MGVSNARLGMLFIELSFPGTTYIYIRGMCRAIKDLHNYTDIIIVPVDKDNATDLPSDATNRRLKKDPTIEN